MRSFHRTLAVFMFAVLLWLGATGSMVQILDLKTILSGAPETDPTMQSINEGKFGDFFDYETATFADLSAQRIPASFDYSRAFETVIGAAKRAAASKAPNFVELRMVGSAPIGQVRFGDDVRAFDAATGDAVQAVSIAPLFPPYSLRQRFKELHRFWFTPEQPGVYFGLLVGLLLWTMIVSGLVLYFRLLNQRRGLQRPNLIWLTGDILRALHRSVSLIAAVFLIAVATSGTLLAFESVWHLLAPRAPHSAPADITYDEILPMVKSTLRAMANYAPNVPIKAIRVRRYGQFSQGVIITDEKVTRQVVFDTMTGKPLDLSTPGYPASGFPFGRQAHEWIKHFHSGYMFGLSGRLMNLFAGLSLVFLSLSGAAMYIQMWRRRRDAGIKNLLW